MGGGGMSKRRTKKTYKRRKGGEIVRKKENAGFVGVACLARIVPEESDDVNSGYPCMMDCGDPDCREWLTLWECDKDGNLLGGMVCYVSECQMEDA
jgi:hypothetical protein